LIKLLTFSCFCKTRVPPEGEFTSPVGVSRRKQSSSSHLPTGRASRTVALVLAKQEYPQRGNSLPPSGYLDASKTRVPPEGEFTSPVGVSRRKQDKSTPRGGIHFPRWGISTQARQEYPQRGNSLPPLGYLDGETSSHLPTGRATDTSALVLRKEFIII